MRKASKKKHLKIILMVDKNNMLFTGVIKENMVWKLKFMEVYLE